MGWVVGLPKHQRIFIIQNAHSGAIFCYFYIAVNFGLAYKSCEAFGGLHFVFITETTKCHSNEWIRQYQYHDIDVPFLRISVSRMAPPELRTIVRACFLLEEELSAVKPRNCTSNNCMSTLPSILFKITFFNL